MPSVPAPVVLLLTHSHDVFTIDRVVEGLRRRGARPVRMDTDRFPEQARLSLLDTGTGPRYLLDVEGQAVDVSEPEAVWTRSFWPPKWTKELDPQYQAACAAQAREMLTGFWAGLRPRRWISRPDAAVRSANKLLQHTAAREVGLTVPRTLVTNDAEEARRFFDRVDGRMVAKMLHPLSMSMGRSPDTVYTSDVTPELLGELDDLRFAPMIFQEKVDKEVELRVKYVCGRLFAGAIDASGTASGQTDWRRAEVAETPWRHDRLPAEVAGRLRRLMARLGLAAGAFDFIRTPVGEHVFLEVNPLGEWGMLERDLGLPISDAIASALLGEEMTRIEAE